MSKKIYDAITLIVAVCTMIIAYLTYDATKPGADEVQSSYEATTDLKKDSFADR